MCAYLQALKRVGFLGLQRNYQTQPDSGRAQKEPNAIQEVQGLILEGKLRASLSNMLVHICSMLARCDVYCACTELEGKWSVQVGESTALQGAESLDTDDTLPVNLNQLSSGQGYTLSTKISILG